MWTFPKRFTPEATADGLPTRNITSLPCNTTATFTEITTTPRKTRICRNNRQHPRVISLQQCSPACPERQRQPVSHPHYPFSGETHSTQQHPGWFRNSVVPQSESPSITLYLSPSKSSAARSCRDCNSRVSDLTARISPNTKLLSYALPGLAQRKLSGRRICCCKHPKKPFVRRMAPRIRDAVA